MLQIDVCDDDIYELSNMVLVNTLSPDFLRLYPKEEPRNGRNCN